MYVNKHTLSQQPTVPKIKSMMYTVLESHAYNNVLVRPIIYFCRSSNFSTFIRTHVQWFDETCSCRWVGFFYLTDKIC